MFDHASWSLSLGRWRGVHLRLHVFFLLFAVFTVFLSWTGSTSEFSERIDWLAVQSLIVLLVSVLLHEIGHAVATRRAGGELEEIVIGPYGGMGEPGFFLFHGPAADLYVALAGPLVNLAVCLSCLPLLHITAIDFRDLLHPLAPQDLTVGPAALVVVKLVFWINWVLLLLNLLPAYPFDGGRMVRAAVSLRWPELPPRTSLLIVAGVARVAAVATFIAAFVFKFDDTHHLVPTRFALILLAILLYFSAKREVDLSEPPDFVDEDEEDERVFGYDFSQGYANFDDPPPAESAASSTSSQGTLKRWLDERKAARAAHQRQLEADEDRRLDEVLARLHEHGLASLSDEDRGLLQRVSDRLRQRKKMTK